MKFKSQTELYDAKSNQHERRTLELEFSSIHLPISALCRTLTRTYNLSDWADSCVFGMQDGTFDGTHTKWNDFPCKCSFSDVAFSTSEGGGGELVGTD